MPLGTLRLTNLSPAKREKLLDRIRVRGISVENLTQFYAWAKMPRQYPVGPWCKDFGSFKAVGRGFEFGTFLMEEQPCFGTRLASVVNDWLAGHIPFGGE